MKKILVTAGIFVFILLTNHAYAAGITYFGTEINLYNNFAHTVLTITFDSPNISKLEIPFFNNVENLKSESNFGGEKCSAERKSYGYDIICEIKPTQEKRMLKLEFDSFDIIKPLDNKMMFNSEFYIPLATKSFYFKVSLPEGMVLAKNKTFQSYMPSNGEKGSDGRRIYIYWEKNDLPAGDSFSSRIFYEPINRQNNFALIGSAFALIAVIFAVGGGVIIFRKMKSGVNVVLPVLKKDEKMIMELIIKHKGGINQKVLVMESNYSKAKVSKVLASLQERGLIRLERRGRTNKVYLSDEYKKKTAEESKEK